MTSTEKLRGAIDLAGWPLSRRGFCAAAGGLLAAMPSGIALAADEDPWQTARDRGQIYADCGRNASRLLRGWIEQKQDPKTGLFSRGRHWDYHNEAADHYSSLVLIAHCVEPALIVEGAPLHRTLVKCRELCASATGLPTTYDLVSYRPGRPATLTQLAEWLRDGLIRISEWLGTNNDWYRETERLVDAMLAASGGPAGLPRSVTDREGQGNMLQTLARLHVMSGKEVYLTAAEALADSILLGDQPPAVPRKLSDHACEWVPGLGELFMVECKLGRPKARQYRDPLQRLLDATLASEAHPVTGLLATNHSSGTERRWSQPPDCWGYMLFTFENFDRGTSEDRYRAALEKPLQWFVAHRDQYADLQGTLWPKSKVSDDWSDSYESMIVLWNRYRQIDGGFQWLDWATHQHIHRRQPGEPYGPYTGGHFDGSTGRTLCMHMMLCSQGVRSVPFRDDLRLGAAIDGGSLRIVLGSDKPWQGTLCFDRPRCEYPTATIDWARINEMPQWFVARPGQKYRVGIDGAAPQTIDGAELIAGLRIECDRDNPRRIEIVAVTSPA